MTRLFLPAFTATAGLYLLARIIDCAGYVTAYYGGF